MKKNLLYFTDFFIKNTAFVQRLFDLSTETKFFKCSKYCFRNPRRWKNDCLQLSINIKYPDKVSMYTTSSTWDPYPWYTRNF